jgi:hypothetical protein
MAQPLLDFLEGPARAALGFMRRAAAAGVTGTAALDVLRAFGLKISTQAFYDVYNALKGNAKLPAYLRITPETTPLPYEAHTTNAIPQGTNYQYVVQVFHAPTNRKQYLTFGSDIPLSQANIAALTDAAFASESVYELTQEEYLDSEFTIIEANIIPGL